MMNQLHANSITSNLTEGQIESLIEKVVERIVAVILEREHSNYSLSLKQLEQGIAPELLTYHANFSVESVDLPFLHKFANHDTSNTAVKNLAELIANGAKVTLKIHNQLCSNLPVYALSQQPIKLATIEGKPIYLSTEKVIHYGAVFPFNHAIAVFAPKSIATSLAKEIMSKNQVNWVISETNLCS